MRRKRRKKIAVDFDGTLSLGRYPSCGPPHESLIKLIKDIMKAPVEERDVFILWTCRKGEALDAAIRWLEEQGLVFDSINEVPKEFSDKFSNDSRKINADIFIDDRAMTPNQFCEKHERPIYNLRPTYRALKRLRPWIG
jgi:uncharacterized HAD superfamily protein